MVIRFYLMVLTLLFCSNLHAQTDGHFYKGVILDGQTKEAVSFVNVVSNISNYGTYSNEEGRFQINISSLKDSVWFSCVGYKNSVVSVDNENINDLDTIFLNSEIYTLNPVTVRTIKSTNTVGYTKMKKYSALHISVPVTYQEAVFIPNEGYNGHLIENLLYRIKRNKYHYKVAIRVHLYEKDKNTGGPGKELLKESIVIKLGNTRNLKVNVQNQNIAFPEEGIFVGFEWIGRIDKETEKYNPVLGFSEPVIFLTKELREARTWSKFGSKSWVLFQNPNSTESMNAMFGLTLID